MGAAILVVLKARALPAPRSTAARRHGSPGQPSTNGTLPAQEVSRAH